MYFFNLSHVVLLAVAVASATAYRIDTTSCSATQTQQITDSLQEMQDMAGHAAGLLGSAPAGMIGAPLHLAVHSIVMLNGGHIDDNARLAKLRLDEIVTEDLSQATSFRNAWIVCGDEHTQPRALADYTNAQRDASGNYISPVPMVEGQIYPGINFWNRGLARPCDTAGTLGYTMHYGTGGSDRLAVIICSGMFTLQNSISAFRGHDQRGKRLDNFRLLPAILLHESMHILRDPDAPDYVGDLDFVTGLRTANTDRRAYGYYGCAALARNKPERAAYNADTLAMLALGLWLDSNVWNTHPLRLQLPGLAFPADVMNPQAAYVPPAPPASLAPATRRRMRRWRRQTTGLAY